MIKETENKLQLIPKIERYIEYMLNVIMKLPRVEKFNIGNEYKRSMYQMLEDTMYISKITDKKKCLELINKIDAKLNAQRIFLRKRSTRWRIENLMQILYNRFNMRLFFIGFQVPYILHRNF